MSLASTVLAHPTDGRIAQRFHLDGGDFPDEAGYRWVCVTMADGMLHLAALKDHEVADWLPVDLPSQPVVPEQRRT